MSAADDFFAKYFPDAMRASQKTGIAPNVILAQAALESNYGKSAPGNNLFGIKGQGSTQTTREFINGRWQTITAAFKGYSSPSASFDGYADFITSNNRYSGVASAGGVVAQANALQRAGYATDPNYGAKVAAIAISGGSGRAALEKYLGSYGTSIANSLYGLGEGLASPGNAIDKAVTETTNKIYDGLGLGQWFERIALALVAVLLIGVALVMLSGKSPADLAKAIPIPV